MPQIQRQCGGQRQGILAIFIVVRDVHTRLHGAGHDLIGVEIAKLRQAHRMGLRTFGGVLPDHPLAGLIGIEHNPQANAHQKQTQPPQGPALKRLTDP